MTATQHQHDFLAKVIIIGDSGVGKTNLLTKFCEDVFRDSYVATIGVDFKLKTVQIDSTKIKLQVWDTAGQERFRNITQTYFKGASAIIVAYQINNRQSFNNLNAWIRQVETINEENICKILIGTKTDLEKEREVRSSEGRQYAEKHGLMFEEVSAKTGDKVEQTFMMLARQIKNKKTSVETWTQKAISFSKSQIINRRCQC